MHSSTLEHQSHHSRISSRHENAPAVRSLPVKVRKAVLRLMWLVGQTVAICLPAEGATLLSEGFEGTGYENTGWVVPSNSSSPPDPDFTAAPLAGSQSLRCNGVSFIQRPFVNSTAFHCYFQVRWLAWSDFKFVVDWLNADQGSTATLFADFGRKLQIVHGGIGVAGTTVISDNTTYHIWLEWTRGTGTDGTMKLFISTTGIKPASPEASINNGQGVATAFFDIGPFGNGADVIYDNVIISDEPIGNNPSANSPPTISNIPNQSILPDSTLGPINFTIGDLETPAADLTVTASSSNTGLLPNGNITLGGSGATRTLTATPVVGQTGISTITVSVSDGTNTASDTFLLTVSAANAPPTISDIPNQTILADTILGPINFSVGDNETTPGNLIVTASSSNNGLVPPINITLGGLSAVRNITITPAAGQSGSSTITVTVSDGQDTASDSFILTVNPTGGPGTFVLDEGFEGTGYENPGWSATTGVPNPDYTVFPLQGLDSLFLASGSSISRAFALDSQFSLYCRARWPDSFVQFASIFQWWTPGFGSQVASVSTEFGDRLQITHGASSATAVIPTIIPNTTYHLWVDWTGNTGAGDGTMRLYVSEDANKPAAPQATLGNGLGAHPAVFVVGPYSGGNGMIVDSLLLADSPIGSNPGGNAAPSISNIPNQFTAPNTTLGPVGFVVVDPETPAADLVVTASSSNTGLVPNSGITLGGTAESRTITVTPATGQIGATIITVQVSDGTNTVSDNFTLTISESGGPPEFVLDEGFEGPGYENGGWNSGTGTPDPDYTFFPLQQAESLFLASGSSINRAFPLHSQFNIYCRARWPDSFALFASLFQWWTPGFASQVASVTTEFGDRLQITHGSAAATAVIPTILANTTYHIWVEWSANTGGGDGTMRIYISDSGDKPASPQAVLNNGLGTSAEVFVVGPYSGGNGVIVDTLLVSEEPIGSNPGYNPPQVPVVTWASPAPVFFGTALGAEQLNATASVPGTFAYSPSAGTILNPGDAQILSVTFTPTDSINYTSATATVTVDVTAWQHQDVGAVGLAGDAAFATGTYTLSGSGTDIWDFADGFHYAYRPWTGDGEIIARVTSIGNTDPWAKAGVMFRETLATDSRHTMIVITPGSGSAFQRRLTPADLSLHTAGPLVAAPYWVRLLRVGDLFQGYISPDGVVWTFVGSETVPMASTLFVGLGVTAHNNTLLSTATFTDIKTRIPVLPPQIAITSPATGSTVIAPTTVSITADVAPNGNTIAKVQFFSNGTLLGEDTDAPYGFDADVASAGGYALSTRVVYADDLVVVSPMVSINAISAVPAPWQHQGVGAVALAGDAVFADGTFSISGSGADIWDFADGFHFLHQPWTGNGEITVRVTSIGNTDAWAKAGVMFRETLATGSRHVLMAITPGNGSAFQRRLATDDASFHTAGPLVAAPYWVKLVRVGDLFQGFISPDGVAWTLVGTESVPMTSTLLVGLAVTAHNNTALNTSTFTDVEVKVPFIPPAIALTSPASGTTFVTPASLPIDASVTANSATITKVQFFANSTLLGEDTDAPYSFNWSATSPGSFALTARAVYGADLAVTSAPVNITLISPLPAPWQHQDVGAVGLIGDATFAGGTYTVSGGGADIWDLADGFHFAYRPWTGNGEIISRVTSIGNTDPWAKAGVMFRETLATDSRHAMMVITPGNGSAFQRRLTPAAASVHTAGPVVTAPYWVRLLRIGNVFQGYISPDGVTWTLVGSETVSMSTTLFVGLAVTAHNNSLVSTATFTGVDVRLPRPAIAITSPASGANFLAPASITTTASVTSNGNAIARVQFYANGSLLGEDTTPPYSFTRTGVTIGTYSLTARAVYATDLAVTSAPVSVNVVSPPSAPTGLTATAVSTNQINLAWAAGSVNHTGFVIERSLNGSSYTQIATTGAATLTYASTGLSANTLYYYRVRATNAFGASSYSTVASTRTFLPLVRINFQPLLSAIPSGYLADSGLTYASRGNGYSYGWNVLNTSTARDRNSTRSPDQRYDTLQHMQVAGAGSTWEIAVPNGSYSVFIVAGDAGNFDSVYRINAEGALTVSGTPTTSTRWISGTRTVTVTDGRLTIGNGTGAVNNKICFIEITQVPPPQISFAAAGASMAFDGVPRIEWLGSDAFGRVSLRVAGVTDGTWEIESSTDLKAWEPFEVVPGTDGIMTFEGANLDGQPKRFFRAVRR